MPKKKKTLAEAVAAPILPVVPEDPRFINGEGDIRKILEKIDLFKHLVRCSRVGYYTLICHPGGENEYPLKGMPQHLHGQIVDLLMDAARDIRDELRDRWNVNVNANDVE